MNVRKKTVLQHFRLQVNKGKLYGVHLPNTWAKKVLLIVHGMGEHISRYEHVIEWFRHKDYAIIGYDQRGHGQSTGKRGHVRNANILLHDLREIFCYVEKQYPNCPIILFGHSMGGNIVLNYALHYPQTLKAVISSSPWLKLYKPPSAFLLKLVHFINCFYPAFTQNNRINPEVLSHNQQVQSDYQNDPLIHASISVSFFIGIEKNAAFILKNADKITVPTLVYHGKNDELTDFETSKDFASKNELITFKAWENLRHECHNENDYHHVLTFLNDWINQT